MPRGASLFDAQNPLHLLMAIHDALMGVMAFTEAGKIHCDISAYNLLLINPEKHYKQGEWLKAPSTKPNPEVWNRTAKGANCAADSASTPQADARESTCPRLARAKKLKRGPVCVVHDTEFTVDEDRTEDKVHSDRTGTPAFISAQLLLSFLPGNRSVTRTFIHDVESLFWVLVWVLAHRSLEASRWKVNDTAKYIITQLSQHNIFALGTYKRSMFYNRQLLSGIRNLENDWSQDLAPVINTLADFFYLYLYFEPTGITPSAQGADSDESESSDDSDLEDPTPSTEQTAQTLHDKYTAESRSQTFARVFKILNTSIRELKHKKLSIDWNRL
ncbi:hypothetical protein FRC08_018098 [Ceratobasidium sp. 394]|nr:hypothetical protein FRC08_018098 [Ceratobasidium sp. 394]